jgi:hypothetical protein
MDFNVKLHIYYYLETVAFMLFSENTKLYLWYKV